MRTIFEACALADGDFVSAYLRAANAVDCRDARGRTPLMIACRNGDRKIVEMLLEAGADATLANDTGTTSLMYAKTVAMGNGDLSIMEHLIRAGADIHARDAAGKTALDYARIRSNLVIDFLTYLGARA